MRFLARVKLVARNWPFVLVKRAHLMFKKRSNKGQVAKKKREESDDEENSEVEADDDLDEVRKEQQKRKVRWLRPIELARRAHTPH